jgi:hypothetical protein
VKRAWIACGVLGVALLFPFDSPVTLLLGVLLLLAFVALGVLVIASPEFLAGDLDGEDESGPGRP